MPPLVSITSESYDESTTAATIARASVQLVAAGKTGIPASIRPLDFSVFTPSSLSSIRNTGFGSAAPNSVLPMPGGPNAVIATLRGFASVCNSASQSLAGAGGATGGAFWFIGSLWVKVLDFVAGMVRKHFCFVVVERRLATTFQLYSIISTRPNYTAERFKVGVLKGESSCLIVHRFPFVVSS